MNAQSAPARTLDIVSTVELADRMPAFLMVAGADGVVKFFNLPWHEYTGQAFFESDPGEWRRYMHPDDGEAVAAAWFEAVSRGEDVVNMRYRIRQASDGDYHWFRARARATRDACGAITHWIGVAVEDDLLAQVERAFARARDANARFASLVDANIIGIITARLSDTTVIEANDEFLRMTGYTREDLGAGRIDWTKLTPPEWRAADQRALAELRARRACTPYEKEIVRKDGARVRYLLGTALVPSSDDEAICYTLDLTAIKSVEAALQRTNEALIASERHFRALADSLPIIAWTAVPDGGVDWYNRGWHEYTGLAADDAAGWAWQKACHPDDLAVVIERRRASVAAGEAFEVEFRLRRFDGLFEWFLARAQPLRDDAGTMLRWYGTYVNIDDQKRALQRSIHIAQTLQNASLPETLPSRPGIRFDGVYAPAERPALIGGDWYDVFDLPDGRIGISIGDVAGHGLAAAVSVGQLRQAILTLAFEYRDPAVILEKVNRTFFYRRQSPFATALVAFVEPDLRTLCYASAGHPPPLLARANGTGETLALGGLPIGVLDHPAVTPHRLELEPGDTIAFYTDGLIESGRDIIAGEAALGRALAQVAREPLDAQPAQTIASMVMGAGSDTDDVALLVLQLSNAVSEPRESLTLTNAWRFHSSDASAAGIVRTHIMHFLRAYGADGEELFTCEVIVGEILANTVQHAPGFVDIDLRWGDGEPTLRFSDSGPGFFPVATRSPGDGYLEHGRGLFLVRLLARAVTVPDSTISDSMGTTGSHILVTLPVKRRR